MLRICLDADAAKSAVKEVFQIHSSSGSGARHAPPRKQGANREAREKACTTADFRAFGAVAFV
jgi:hypothetical protein